MYDYYSSRKKLKLKSIKYFAKPISAKDIGKHLAFVNNMKKSSNAFLSEYRQISKEDFVEIRKRATLINSFPPYLEELSISLNEFILNTIRAVYKMLKNYPNLNQIEIKVFLNILKKFLDEYDIKKSLSDIQEFYARHAVELGFKHVPSRDPDKFVALYTTTGEKKNFAYISLE